jgi:hypothetical protein
LSSSPFIEALKRELSEASYVVDPIGEYAVQQLKGVRWEEDEVPYVLSDRSNRSS